MNYDIKDIKLAEKGKLRIEWTGNQMAVLNLLKKRFEKEKPLKDINLGACLHVTAETANLVLTLKAGGAKVFLCASNPLSTQDDVAASLVKDYEIPVFAIKGENNKIYYEHLEKVLQSYPKITMDDGADLISMLHKNYKPSRTNNSYSCSVRGKLKGWEFLGSSEETTTGVIRLRAMEKDGALKVPVIAVNDSDTKHLFDNRYGTGQSTIDGIMRATNLLLAGKIFVVVGYGWCGRGIANRARGMGAKVIIIEVDPVKALEAVMDGFEVMAVAAASKIGEIFVTATGDKNVIDINHIKLMRDGAILANSGHFNVEVAVDELEKIAVSKRQVREFVTEYEIDAGPAARSSRPTSSLNAAGARRDALRSRHPLIIKRIYVLGEGRLINLVAAEGHPPEVMDMSFANQALAAEWLVQNRGKLEPKVYTLPKEMDREIAKLKLESMDVEIDKLTEEQEKYLKSWQEGT